MPPHIKCCGCCCSLNVGVMIGSGLYIAFLLIFSFVLPFTGTQEDIEHAKAFCAGTTAVYRKGDEFGSALAPIDHQHHSASLPLAALSARRLRRVLRLRRLRWYQLGRREFGGEFVYDHWHDYGHSGASAPDRNLGPHHQEARGHQQAVEGARGVSARLSPGPDRPSWGRSRGANDPVRRDHGVLSHDLPAPHHSRLLPLHPPSLLSSFTKWP